MRVIRLRGLAVVIAVALSLGWTFMAARQTCEAQQLSATQGGLAGVITDSTGAIIPGAKVSIAGAMDSRVTTTDDLGRFTVGSLTPGLYTVTVEKAGFKTEQAKKIEVVINRSSSINLTLTPGGASETVEVDAAAVQLDTNSTAVGSDLTETFYQLVPVARNVGSLFYTAPGVTDGGGTGGSNPSVGGATGLENSYTADGVSVGDAGYGGLGVYSPTYGSLGTGINLSFIQEVQVKTGAFEPKYGKADGGLVQIVTKSGSNKYHGAVTTYFAPEAMAAGDHYLDNYRTAFPTSFQYGKVFSQPAYDGSVELGGYIPIKKDHDHLFFFGSYNPSLTQVNMLAPNTPFSQPLYKHGPFTSSILTNNWAAKLTYKLNDSTSFDVSAFGDPARSNYAFNAESADPFSYAPPFSFQQQNTSAFDTWNYGSRSVVARMTSALSSNTVINLSASTKTSHFTDAGFSNIYSITDKTSGSYPFQGLGEFQNPNTNDYAVSADGQQTVKLLGTHTFSLGWSFERTIYDSTRDYSGPRFPLPAAIATAPGGNASLVGLMASAAFYLANAPSACKNTQLCPIYPATGKPVYLRQVRGIVSTQTVNSSEGYHVLYGNDNYTIGKHLTFNLGLRWEEEQINGPNQSFVMNDNWSPRLGVNLDPFGDRKSKIFMNWGRYTQALPTDAAIRELNEERDVTTIRWGAPAKSDGTLAQNPDGTVTPILDSAHLLNGNPTTGYGTTAVGVNPSTPELFAPGTKLNYEEEYVLGVEREVSGGIVLSATYSDRQLKRIIEDMGGVSPEGANAGVPQVFVIGNPNPTADYFVNEQEEKYTGATPANCSLDYGDQQDSLGNDLGSACGLNANTDGTPGSAGYPTPDGKPDGFAKPVRRYQALEIEANKNFSHNFLMRVNYRWAKLNGNYEGLFRNDNGQSDPGISSLFDFTQGILGLLGAQFAVGPLNTDRRQVGNLYASYTVPNGLLRRLTVGTGFRGQSGTPINKLLSHPVYQNRGEVPDGGRGTGGRMPSTTQWDMHTDYPIALGEKSRIKLAFDTFNVLNSRPQTNVNQFLDTGFQLAADPTWGTPTTFQRAFYARGSLRWEF